MASLLPLQTASQSFYSHRPYFTCSIRSHSTNPVAAFKAKPISLNAPLVSLVEDSSPASPDVVSIEAESAIEDADKFLLRACKACGREELEKGCNGEGRIQGGIATVPGFGWWPIKAYRPCPGYVASGGKYRRRGQNMDEVAFGGGRREPSVISTDEVPASKERPNPRRFKT
ncbi:uncharacterized protein LOC122068066 isoform X2 [Macadamia integrifolia]|uniref:uncharacterized protein LOC122068066 isoform X2 n=1 Tax=Macadamia integrifolia TaxID=60698 RepID=UPI001C501711|nr:uncharacterized protein LOC122068066 isoform X2 [Macadamia integrifolia]